MENETNSTSTDLEKWRKQYKCKTCNSKFSKRLSTDRYCSYKCASADKKTIERSPIKKTISKSNKYYGKVRQLILDKYIDEEGYFTCEHCGISSSTPLEIHHIFYRSEIPNHKHLNNPLNLIMCCRACHEFFHYSKDNRKRIVEERGLNELFFDRFDRYSKGE